MHRTSLMHSIVWVAALSVILTTTDMTHAAAPNAPDRVVQIAGLDVAVWLPTSSAGPHPLVLFSHGFGGCKTQSSYLMRVLAQRGILVTAPDHKDNQCATGRPPAVLPPEFLNPTSWSASFYDERRDDLQKLRAALQTEPAFSGLIDTRRLALVGHSLGGYTVLGLAGAWPSWKMNGIAAVVALAPFAQPFLNGGTLALVSAPVLFQAGTEDHYITEALEQGGIFAATAVPACKVVYQGANHFAWTDLQADFHGVTAAATAAFLEESFAGHRPTTAILASPQTARAECK